jgi:hypothetical protein
MVSNEILSSLIVCFVDCDMILIKDQNRDILIAA